MNEPLRVACESGCDFEWIFVCGGVPCLPLVNHFVPEEGVVVTRFMPAAVTVFVTDLVNGFYSMVVDEVPAPVG